MNIPVTYDLIHQEYVKEIGAEVYMLHHKKSQAKLMLVDVEDDNKVFSITFRTPPANGKGIPHILEHSVLCGSKKYPLHDPFVELAKGSLNTFLNAMTYPEKTMYPVASTNDQDFKNLMDVYMDAVFQPNIYREKKIFEQEGWHYELQDKTDELRVNGVVYNEMRGAFSDPESVMERAVKELLFKDTPYANESGGDPKQIPFLDYEEFLNFHRKYYHPSNSYIYLYGKMDFEERLHYLDDEYLSSYDAIDPDSEIKAQVPYDEIQRSELPYGISDGEDEETEMFTYSKVIGGMFDPVRFLAYEVLSYALINAPGAPIRKALLEKEMADEIYGGYDTGYMQPSFGVTIKGARKEQFEEFKDTVDAVLQTVSKEGISKKSLLAGINNIEFSLREADYGRYPKGLIYAMQVLDTWLFDEEKALIHLKYNDTIRTLKEMVNTDFYEKLVEEILSVTHGVLLRVYPKKGLLQEEEKELKERLLALKNSLSEEEIQALIDETVSLQNYQEEVPTEEELKCIPLLKQEDLKKEAEPFVFEEREISGKKAVFHDIHTSGICYVELRFPLIYVPFSSYSKVSILKNLLTMMNTKNFDYQELNDEISLYTGGISYDTASYHVYNKDEFHTDFIIRGRVVYENMREFVRLIKEITFQTDFSDTDRIKEILSEIRSEMQSSMISAGHSTAVKRMLSYQNVGALVDEHLSGLDFYEVLDDLLKNFDANKEALSKEMQQLVEQIFVGNNLLISVISEEDGFASCEKTLPDFIGELKNEDRSIPEFKLPEFEKKNEGLTSASQVQYVAKGGSFKVHGYNYHGAMKVMKTLLGYDYLWLNARVKGGAYGCMSLESRNGEMAFVTYRDPNLKETLDIFDGIPAYLGSLQVSDRDMLKYIIGTMSEMDTPMTPKMKGRRSLMAYLAKIPYDVIQKERDEVLNCTVSDLRALKDVVSKVLSENQICVVGNEEVISANQDVFLSVRPIVHDGNEM